MMPYGGVEATPRILNLDTGQKWVVSFTSRPLCFRGKEPRYPLSRRMGWPPSWSERDSEERNLTRFESWQGLGIFSSSPRPDRLWGLPSIISNGYRGLFPWEKSRQEVKLTTHLQLVRTSRMRGAVPPLPQYAFMAWCSAKAQGQLYLYLSLSGIEPRSSSP
jgi:hypothetical protein